MYKTLTLWGLVTFLIMVTVTREPFDYLLYSTPPPLPPPPKKTPFSFPSDSPTHFI